MTGPNNLVKAALPKVTHLRFPFAITVTALGLSFNNASSAKISKKKVC